MPTPDPLKDSALYARIPAQLRTDLRASLKQLGLTEPIFLRACAEAMVESVRNGEQVLMPIRLRTTREK